MGRRRIHAGLQLRLACTTTGTVSVSGGDAWTLSGGGTCTPAGTHPAYTVALSGTGTSQGAGKCDGLTSTVTNLDITVVLTLTSSRDNRTYVEHFTAPSTTFPGQTPFAVADVLGGALGSGTLTSHIAGRCAGANTAWLTWSQLL